MMSSPTCTAALRWLGAAISLLPLCCTAAGPTPSHHRVNGFQNNYLEFEPKGLAALLRWKLDAARDGLPVAPRTATPVVPPGLAFIHANATAGRAMQSAITWMFQAKLSSMVLPL